VGGIVEELYVTERAVAAVLGAVSATVASPGDDASLPAQPADWTNDWTSTGVLT
jgi:hypothetical protein